MSPPSASRETSSKPRAFVLISFEQQFESVYNDLIKVPLEVVGFEVFRADSRLDQRSILQDIFRGIADADLIVADLTGLNPNVFYELGVAHALAIPTILLTQNLEELPFDLRAYRANEYSTHFQEASKVIATISEVGRATIDGSISFSSPATDFLPPEFSRNRLVARIPAVSEPEPSSGTVDQEELEEPELAWLDALNEAEPRNTQFMEALGRISEATESIGSTIERRTVEINRAAERPESERVKRTSTLAIRVADDLNNFAAAIEAELPVYEETSGLLLDPMSQYLAWLQAHPDPEATEQLADLSETASGLLEAVRETLPSIREFRETVYGLRGISRAINSASARVVAALDRFISGTETIEAEATRMVTVSDSLTGELSGPAEGQTVSSRDRASQS